MKSLVVLSVSLLLVGSSIAAEQTYGSGFEPQPPVPFPAKFVEKSFSRIPPRPNRTLERTADRRKNLLSMTSTLKSAAELAVVSGRSAWSR
jgi:hypothetical protein